MGTIRYSDAETSLQKCEKLYKDFSKQADAHESLVDAWEIDIATALAK